MDRENMDEKTRELYDRKLLVAKKYYEDNKDKVSDERMILSTYMKKRKILDDMTIPDILDYIKTRI